MYAVIRTGGKQYRVTAGDIVEVEKLGGAVGDTITLDDVLMVANDEDITVGQPVVDDASVTAKITGQYRGKKIMVFRYRPKKRIRVRKGHRQYLTRLEIESITANGETFTRSASQKATPQASTPPVPEEEPAETPPVDETVLAAGAAEPAVEATVVEEPVAAAQTGETVSQSTPAVDETSAAAQEEPDTKTDGEASDSDATGAEESSENSDSGNSDSTKENKE